MAERLVITVRLPLGASWQPNEFYADWYRRHVTRWTREVDYQTGHWILSGYVEED